MADNENENTGALNDQSTWDLSQEVKDQLKSLMDQLRKFSKEHDLPAVVLIQTENNLDTYAAEGFVHFVKDKTAGDMQMLTWLAHLLMNSAEDPVAQALLEKLADMMNTMRVILAASNSAEG